METIKAKEVRELFLNKNGMPKKDCLMSMDQVCEALAKPVPQSGPERYYVRAVNHSVMTNTRKYFHNHHIMFIAPKIGATVLYGFSRKQAYIDNYMERLHGKTKTHAVIEGTFKHIANGQLELTGSDGQKLLE